MGLMLEELNVGYEFSIRYEMDMGDQYHQNFVDIPARIIEVKHCKNEFIYIVEKDT
jgi:hypothetical protein